MKLSKEAKEAQRAYNREWARKNREKRAAYMAAYWERKAAEKKKEESLG